MSLEAGNYIKDLVVTNPEGTDPKSQGDDHLRLIKSILKTQFSGFNQGRAIYLTEDMVNANGGTAVQVPAGNVDVVIPYHCVLGIVGTSSGTMPNGTQAGDIIHNFCYQSDRLFQVLYQQTGATYRRRQVANVWGPWSCLTPIGEGGQNWVQPSRAFNTLYTNDTGRAIAVQVSAGVTSTSGGSITMYVNGVPVSQAVSANSLIAVNVSGIVPPGGTYQLATSIPFNLTIWVEMR